MNYCFLCVIKSQWVEIYNVLLLEIKQYLEERVLYVLFFVEKRGGGEWKGVIRILDQNVLCF